ncbi:TetR/AcrR family transcriptional regulator C-terminal domain-containing protein [Streptomyces triculaminicus]|uniref:TetR/AcrR family transcriptional regulator C-terminal domain-containing protein n=2 Tax=Streptomyces triculaminicus TaxID=2816232 RepID=A0A939JT34_9ACTN|nr:TetR/AcrR family transcriptional regulator [Streptomyces triculaminicus]MBO0656502.1 TetR/AcrR family transcriptional regulator C-terminal domain-containing protein [Streptomyces triculaminicus]
MASSLRTTSVWLAGEGEGKASKRKGAGAEVGGLDRDRIVATTVRMLDTDGLAKFSMRRLAAELGVTAMSVYWYVDNKDDLLELAMDQASAGMSVPDVSDESADWRDQVRELATEYRKMLVAHPWVAQLVGRYLNIGPHSMAFSEAALAVIRRMGLDDRGVTGALNAVFQFVYGFATIEVLYRERCREAGVSEDDYLKQVMGVIAERPEFSKQYKEAAELVEARGTESIATIRNQDFTYALDMMIAGMEAMQAR